MTPEQQKNLEANVRQLIKAQKDIKARMSEIITGAQKMGYSVNPKTGEVKKLNN